MTDEYNFDFGDFDGDMNEKDSEIMVLQCMYPDRVKSIDEGKGILVTLNSLTRGVPDCEARFIFAEGYPYANPPLVSIQLTMDKKAIFERLQRNMEKKLMHESILLVERGESTVVTSLLESLSRMMIIGYRSSCLQRSLDANCAFSYSMDYIDVDVSYMDHPLIGSMFAMLTSDVVLLIMQKMDAGTLFRFQSTCKTFWKLVDEHPELYRKCMLKYDKRQAYSCPDKGLRSATRSLIKGEEIARERRARLKKEQELLDQQRRDSTGYRIPDHFYYISVPSERKPGIILPQSTRDTFWERREKAAKAKSERPSEPQSTTESKEGRGRKDRNKRHHK